MGDDWRLPCIVYFENFRNYFKSEEKSKGERDEGPPCSRKLGRLPIGNKLEAPPAESALRIAPVFKEPPAARTRGLRDQRKNPGS